MSFEKNVVHLISYGYDFQKDGGSIGQKELRPLFVNKLKEGLLIVRAELTILTQLAGASAVATIGDQDDLDGYFLDLVGLSAGHYSSLSTDRGGAYLRQTVATTPVALGANLIKEVLANRPVLLDISGGALTAGKFELHFHCLVK